VFLRCFSPLPGGIGLYTEGSLSTQASEETQARRPWSWGAVGEAKIERRERHAPNPPFSMRLDMESRLDQLEKEIEKLKKKLAA
jgi:hypothetical protein